MKNKGLGVGKGTPRWELKGWAAQCLPTIHKILCSVKRRGHPWEENGAEGCTHVNSHSQSKSAFVIVVFPLCFQRWRMSFKNFFLKLHINFKNIETYEKKVVFFQSATINASLLLPSFCRVHWCLYFLRRHTWAGLDHTHCNIYVLLS